MFLICNGILFLLATSSFIHHSSPSSFHPCNYSFAHDLVSSIQEEKTQELIVEEEIYKGELEEELEEDDEEGCFTDEVEEEEEEEGKGCELELVVSTEELNKKIEEFIRKMKEEMRIEAVQTHLIAV